MSLNTHSPVPLYRQLAQRLRGHIERGDIAVSEKIPSENELASEYGIGRPTVRQATDLLVREGILQRRRGAGTFGLAPGRRIDLFSLTGTSNALMRLDLQVQIEMQGQQGLTSGPRFLADRLVDAPVFAVSRVSRIEAEPVLLEDMYLDAVLFNGFEHFDLSNASLSQIAREHYFLEASSADQDFEIISIDSSKGSLLDLEAGTPVLKVSRRIHFGEHRDGIYAEIFCRTDRYRFSQTITTSDIQNREPYHAQ